MGERDKFMNDEAAIGSAGAPDRGGHPPGSAGEQSPLQARAAFLKNWSWQSVVGYNRGACARGGAQHGPNPETQEACAKEWEQKRCEVFTLAEFFEFLRHCHRRAPFLFFNGNTFADIARQIAAALFADLPSGRRRTLTSAVAHYIAGVLDREDMVQTVEELCIAASFQPGDRVKTLRGSKEGMVVRVLPDGRVTWKPDGSGSELTSLPESLLPLPT
jgi:hypothetical protein